MVGYISSLHQVHQAMARLKQKIHCLVIFMHGNNGIYLISQSHQEAQVGDCIILLEPPIPAICLAAFGIGPSPRCFVTSFSLNRILNHPHLWKALESLNLNL
ncbi:hypothetical protein SLEP1_g1314 [Rubroshorea leprosula]|uniref:Uncharacterized protein n=1 Tax=Rubroshorea leprosula TaxID=152421 RepID=A0AAV5HJA6_9ROSI|nr:hypothetical protein SLEP1_g1314 [Rubroshorea leprosula]